MAHTRTHHPIRLWTGKQQTETGLDRLVILSWKGNKTTGREAHSARCVSIPMWTPELSGPDKDFVDILVNAVELRQKATAHAYVTNMLETNGGVCNDIPAELVSPQAILSAFLAEDTEDNSRGKLSGEQIGGWFVEKLEGLIHMSIATSKGWLEDGYQMSPEEEKKLKQASAGYKATLERLAAPQPRVDISTAKALRKAVELLGDAREMDTIARKLERKLEAIINPSKENDFSLEELM